MGYYESNDVCLFKNSMQCGAVPTTRCPWNVNTASIRFRIGSRFFSTTNCFSAAQMNVFGCLTPAGFISHSPIASSVPTAASMSARCCGFSFPSLLS